MAMIKLWETSSIAKIALKRGVQLTTSERMAEEIKVIKPCSRFMQDAFCPDAPDSTLVFFAFYN